MDADAAASPTRAPKSRGSGGFSSELRVPTTNEGARAQGGLTPDFLALSEAVAGVAIFPNFSAEQGAHGFTDFNDLARQQSNE